MTGHLLGAAGGLEAGICALAVRDSGPTPAGFARAFLIDENFRGPLPGDLNVSAWIVTAKAPEFGSLGFYFARDLAAAVLRRLVSYLNDFNTQTRQSQARERRKFTEQRAG